MATETKIEPTLDTNDKAREVLTRIGRPCIDLASFDDAELGQLADIWDCCLGPDSELVREANKLVEQRTARLEAQNKEH